MRIGVRGPNLLGMLYLMLAGGVAVGAPGSMQSLSSPPRFVSGGDSLIRLDVRPTTTWQVWLNGRDVSEEFRPGATGEYLVGLVKGLRLGSNALQVMVERKVAAHLTLINHPLSGPMFSGPPQTPFLRQTEESGLKPSEGPRCETGGMVQYYYKTTHPSNASALATADSAIRSITLAPGFKLLGANERVPDDV